MPPRNQPSDEDIEFIRKEHRLSSITSVEHLPHAPGNSVFKLETNEGVYLLKIFDLIDEEYVVYELDVLDHLLAHNIPVPKTYKTKNNERIITVKNRPCILQEWMDGVVPEMNTQILLCPTGEMLGKIHKALETCSVTGRHDWDKSNELRKPFLNQNLPEDLRTMQKEVESIIFAADMTDLPEHITHGDIYFNNLLVKNNDVVAVLDWSDAHLDYRAADLAVLLAGHGTNRKTWNHDKLNQILDGYQKHIKLLEKEKQALHVFCLTRMMNNILWCHKTMKDHPDQAELLKEYLGNDVLLYKDMASFKAWIDSLPIFS